jgi:hypothetical protein
LLVPAATSAATNTRQVNNHESRCSSHACDRLRLFSSVSCSLFISYTEVMWHLVTFFVAVKESLVIRALQKLQGLYTVISIILSMACVWADANRMQPAVASSTTAARRSPHSSNPQSDTSLPRLQLQQVPPRTSVCE